MKEEKYTVDLNEQGIFQFKTKVISGFLKCFMFKIPQDMLGNEFVISSRIENTGIVIFNERVNKDSYYSIKIQDFESHDKYSDYSNSDYVLNEPLMFTVQGSPFDSIEIIVRWIEY